MHIRACVWACVHAQVCVCICVHGCAVCAQVRVSCVHDACIHLRVCREGKVGVAGREEAQGTPRLCQVTWPCGAFSPSSLPLGSVQG